jgi:NADPH:quinone reductase-like Zn-dependent oxidoreductase
MIAEAPSGPPAAFMRAIRLHEPRGPDGLVSEQIPTPRPGPGEALVRVHAAAITRDELEWPVDRLPATPSYEFSGVVVTTGPEVSDVAVGDAVYALTGFDRDGAAADFIVLPATFMAPKPRALDHVHAAALPLAALSAWQALFDHGRLAAGQRVLIHGAAGGVGHLAVQLARGRGAHVIATASTRSLGQAQELGPDQLVDHTTTRFEEVIDPVDLVFDTVGGDLLTRSPAVLRPGGRLVSVADEPPTDVEAGREIVALYFVVEPNREQLLEIATLADSGELRPMVGEVFDLVDARSAFARTMSRDTHGKVVLRTEASHDDGPQDRQPASRHS